MRGWARIAVAAAVLSLVSGAAIAQQDPAHGPAAEPDRNFDKPTSVTRGGPFEAGIAAMKAKHYHEAVAKFGALTDETPQDVRVWELLGAAHAGELNWKASRKAYEKAVKLAPEDIAAHAGLGLALQALKDPGLQAQSDWLKAKSQVCANVCPDAARLKAVESSGLFVSG